jgi:hypothetical protein
MKSMIIIDPRAIDVVVKNVLELSLPSIASPK